MEQTEEQVKGDNTEKEEDPNIEGKTKEDRKHRKLKRKEMTEQKRKDFWKETRKKEKEKKRQKIRELLQTGEVSETLKLRAIANSRKRLNTGEIEYIGSIIIDLSFDQNMSDKEVKSLANQINHCYSRNLRANNPVELYLTSYGGNLEKKLNTYSPENWKHIIFEPRSYVEAFDKSKLVYLSSESPNILKELDLKNKCYIIGGLVDHNRLKGLTFKQANDLEIETAQLPIGEYIAKIQGRKVLTVNQVLEILLKYIDTKDWAQSLELIVPLRKGGVRTTIQKNDQLKENKEVLSQKNPEMEQQIDQNTPSLMEKGNF